MVHMRKDTPIRGGQGEGASLSTLVRKKGNQKKNPDPKTFIRGVRLQMKKYFQERPNLGKDPSGVPHRSGLL